MLRNGRTTIDSPGGSREGDRFSHQVSPAATSSMAVTTPRMTGLGLPEETSTLEETEV
jgi:hypothetical protein